MKKKIVLLMMFAMITSAALGQTPPLVSIYDIQYLSPGQDTSSYFGDTVSTGGVVTSGTGLFYAGSGVSFYIGDPDGGPWSGIMAICPDPQGFPDLVVGDSVLFTALVTEAYYQTTLLVEPGTIEFRAFGLPEPPPTVIPASYLDLSGIGDSLAIQYEGVFCRIYDLTVDTVINYSTTSVWECHDSTGVCLIREASDSIPNSYRPDEGTEFEFIQGVVGSRIDGIHLQPRYMRDLRLANFWADGFHYPRYPLVGDTVTFYVQGSSDLDSVWLYYAMSNGNSQSVLMQPQGNNRWTFLLPSPEEMSIDYYMTVYIDSWVMLLPPEAPFNFYEYIVQYPQAMTIADAKIDSDNDFVPDLLDSAVTVTGVVTTPNFHDTQTNYFIQSQNSGINIYYDSTQIEIEPGDSVTIAGIVDQVFGLTQIRMYKSNWMTYHSPGTVPEPNIVTCFDLGDINGEEHEGELVRIEYVQILDIPDPWPPFGFSANMTIVDFIDSAGMRIDRYTNIDGQPQYDLPATITGIVTQNDNSSPYMSRYQLLPRFYEDFDWITGIDDNLDKPVGFGISQNYPNPFNASTTIEFTLPEEAGVELVVYDLLGREIKTLIDERRQAGIHSIIWDAKDVPSGIYFARLEAQDKVRNIKMVLLK